MASPRTRRALKELKPKDDNNVSKIDVGHNVVICPGCCSNVCNI